MAKKLMSTIFLCFAIIFKRFKFEKAELINSYKYFKEALSIPIYPNMKLNEQIKVISIIKKTLR